MSLNGFMGSLRYDRDQSPMPPKGTERGSGQPKSRGEASWI